MNSTTDNDSRSWHRAQRARSSRHQARKALLVSFKARSDSQDEAREQTALLFIASNLPKTPKVESRCSAKLVGLANRMFPGARFDGVSLALAMGSLGPVPAHQEHQGKGIGPNLRNLEALKVAYQYAFLTRRAYRALNS